MNPIFRQHGCRITAVSMRGHDLVILENATIRVVVTPTKGADILELRYKPLDIDALARTPNDLSAPGLRVPSIPSARGSFLDHSYLGWQEVLPNGGPATTYAGAELGVHGEVAMLPWTADVVVDEADRIAVRFSVDLLRTPFRLVREMVVEGARPEVILRETVVNLGEQRMPLMWGHHPDFGPPIVDVGALLDMPPAKVHTLSQDSANRRLAPDVACDWPMVAGIDGRQHDLSRVLAKSSRVDDSFYLELLTDGWAAVRNPELGLGFAMLWDAEVFPYVWSWQSYGGSFGYPHYGRLMNLAIEPFTSPVGALADLVATDRAVRWLEPSESMSTSLRFRFLTDVDAPFAGPDDPRAGSERQIP